nr:hypothetical protein CFP56_70567 [Quercus suber]
MAEGSRYMATSPRFGLADASNRTAPSLPFSSTLLEVYIIGTTPRCRDVQILPAFLQMKLAGRSRPPQDWKSNVA